MARPLLARARRSAIAQGIGANVATQIASSIAQLALVPVFATRWGVATYGAWLLLFTLPSYINMADFGLGAAAGNDMTGRVARGDRTGTIALYRAIRLVSLTVGATALLAAALVLFLIAPHLLDGVDAPLGGAARPIALVLAGYGSVGLQSSVTAQGHRATGGYAAATYISAATMLAEAIGAAGLVLAGGSVMTVALWYLAARMAGTGALSLALRRRAPWLAAWRWRSSAAVLRPLLRPAAAVMVFPAALAASFQGTVIVIGTVLGAAAVPAFTAVRTLSRVAVQAVLIVNHAIMPAMTAARAIGDEARVARYATASFAVSLALVVPGALGLLLGGRWFVALWTHGALHPSVALLAVVAASMVLNAIWAPAANLILAINRHEGYTWLYLIASLAALGLCVPLTRWLGTPGAALSVVLVDAVMLARVAGLSRRLGLIDWRAAGPTLMRLVHRQ